MNLQDWANERVPHESQKFIWLWLFLIQIGVAICLPVFVYGGQIANALSFKTLLIGLFAGGALTGVLAAITTAIGQKTRLSTTLIGQRTFGRSGNLFLVFFIFLASLGWWGVQTEIMASAFIAVMKETYAIELSKPFVVVAGGLLMITTSVLGVKAIGRLSYIAVPGLLALILLPLWMIASEGRMPDILGHVPAQQTMGLGFLIASMVGGYMTGILIFPDFGRFLKTQTDAALASFLTCGVFYPFLVALSAVLAISLGTPDFIAAMPAMGLGLFALVVIVFATWTSNDCNLYSATLPVATYVPSLSRPVITILAGLAGIVFASIGLFESFIPWLVLMGVFLAPFVGCYVAAYFLNPSQYMEESDAVKTSWRPLPLAAWAAGSVAGLLTTPADGFGFGVFKLTSAPTIDAFLVAGLVMLAGYVIEGKGFAWSRG